jgi:hypothetical protein
MSIHKFGPDNASLTVRTGRTGAAAKAGHDLLIEVCSWEATLDVDAEPALVLTADSRSFRVLDGTGGIQALGEDDKASVVETIEKEVMKGAPIAFRSTKVRRDGNGSGLTVEGELELTGKRAPARFELAVDGDGRLSGAATVKQTDWGIKPYTTLFGTLKVADEVQVAIEAKLDQVSL